MDVKREKICRLCATSISSGYNVFAEKDGIHYQQLIQKYIYILVTEEDMLPFIICKLCKQTLIQFDEFAMRCLQIQEELLANNINIVQLTTKNEEIEGLVKVEPVYENQLELKNVDHFTDDVKDSNYKVVQLYENGKIRMKLKTRKKSVNKKKNNGDYAKDTDFRPIKKCCKTINKNENKKGRWNKYDYSSIKFICHICQVEFLDGKILKQHTMSEHNVVPQIICYCNTVLNSMKGLRTHFRYHAQKSNELSCNECNMLFSTTLKLERHLRLVHKKEEFMLPCGSCDKKFLNITLLKKHQKKHLPKELTHIYRCLECDGIYESMYQLETHKQFVHNKETLPKLICDVCGKEFLRKNYLKCHIMKHTSKQSNERIKCVKCSQSFISNYQLTKHMKLHKNVKFRCTICSMVLASEETLKQHFVIHEDVFKYKCRYCDKQYKRNMDRKHHENRHLGITPYECPWCPKKFVDNSHLRNHKKTQHPKELADYEAIHGPPRGAVKKIKEIDQDTQIIAKCVKRTPQYSKRIL